MKSINEARDYFYHLHDVECNQKYSNNLPYSFHLDLVGKQADLFKKYIPFDDPYYSAVWIGVYGHDSIEDARVSYNQIKDMFGELSAEIIFLCTEYKGRSRAERKPDQFYIELKENDLAVFVKLCDIIANSKFSLLTNSTMFEKYKSEYKNKVRKYLFSENYRDMFVYLDKIYEI
jgi:(p)ppGpp synthase/HD superfamily hydrolase